MNKATETCVPVAALAMPGEQEGQSTPPAQGDTVDFSATGKVTRIEGDKAYIALESVNGQEIDAAAEAAEPSLDEEEASIRPKASDQMY